MGAKEIELLLAIKNEAAIGYPLVIMGGWFA
jgi:hypothetical protein